MAVDLLGDGVAASAPRFKKNLVRRALSLLDGGPRSFDRRLASFFEADTLAIFDEEITSRLKAYSLGTDAAYVLLGQLLQSHADWANVKLLEYWPKDAEQVMSVVERIGVSNLSVPLVGQIRSAEQMVSPRRASFAQRRVLLRRRHSLFGAEEVVEPLSEVFLLPPGCAGIWESKDLISVGVLSSKLDVNFNTEFVSVDADAERFGIQDGSYQNGWAVIKAVSKFVREPRRETLSEVAESLSHVESSDDIAGMLFPWPVQSIICDFREGCPISTLVTEAREGQFGDLPDWRKAEQRWITLGLTSQDFLQWNEGRYLNSRISEVGAPGGIDVHLQADPGRQKGVQDYQSAVELAQGIISIKKRECIIDALVSGLREITDTGIRKSAVAYLVGEASNYPESNWYIYQLMGAPESWNNDLFLKSLEARAEQIEPYRSRSAMDAKKVDLNGRWRRLLPLFADQYVRQRAHSESNDFEKLEFVPSDQDAEDVRDAITLINFAQDGVRASDVPRLVQALERRSVEPRTLRALLKKRTAAGERLAILLEMAKRAQLEPERRSLRWMGYVEELQNELESQPSPLTQASELTRLDLPSL